MNNNRRPIPFSCWYILFKFIVKRKNLLLFHWVLFSSGRTSLSNWAKCWGVISLVWRVGVDIKCIHYTRGSNQLMIRSDYCSLAIRKRGGEERLVVEINKKINIFTYNENFLINHRKTYLYQNLVRLYKL